MPMRMIAYATTAAPKTMTDVLVKDLWLRRTGGSSRWGFLGLAVALRRGRGVRCARATWGSPDAAVLRGLRRPWPAARSRSSRGRPGDGAGWLPARAR